jgi:hypothetical protein
MRSGGAKLPPPKSPPSHDASAPGGARASGHPGTRRCVDKVRAASYVSAAVFPAFFVTFLKV